MSNVTSKTSVKSKAADTIVVPKGVTWGPATAVVATVVVYFAAQILGGLLVFIYPRARGWDRAVRVDWLNSVVGQFWLTFAFYGLTFGAIWWFMHMRKAKLRSIGWRKPGRYDIVFALAGFGVYFVAYIVLLSAATHLFPSINVDQKQQLGFTDTSGTRSLVLAFISLVVLPPLVEETVFRGFLYTGLRNKLKPVWAAVCTSLLFATAHLQIGSGNPLLWAAAIDTFTLSLVLCYLRQETDSLIPGMFLHAIKNSVAFITLFLIHPH